MGCKLHTLLLTNSCKNPEEEAFKKLNLISRYPLTVDQPKKLVAEKLSRVLLIDIIKTLKIRIEESDTQIEEPGLLNIWRNLMHITQLAEEMMYTSKQDVQDLQGNEERNDRNVNLNTSLLEWQK